MALIDRWLESLDEEIGINKSCVRDVSPFSTCDICIKNCLENALEIKNRKVNINRNCNSCGDCIPSCPVNAIEGIAKKIEIVGDILLFIDHTNISLKELLYYYHKGIRKIGIIDKDLNPSWKAALDEINKVLTEMDNLKIEITKDIKYSEAEEMEISRRELFSFFKKESKSFITKLTPATWRFNHKDYSLEKMYPEWQFYSIEINKKKCNLCQACFKLCPTKVFVAEDEQITINAVHCVDCKLCEDVCKEKAIHINSKIIRTESNVNIVFQKTCRNCESKFLSWNEEDDKCFICDHISGFLHYNRTY